jgi:hypothetical protein
MLARVFFEVMKRSNTLLKGCENTKNQYWITAANARGGANTLLQRVAPCVAILAINTTTCSIFIITHSHRIVTNQPSRHLLLPPNDTLTTKLTLPPATAASLSDTGYFTFLNLVFLPALL